MLTIDRIFHEKEFSLESVVPSKWLDDGNYYTTVEESADIEDGFDIVRHDPATGERMVLVSAATMTPQGGDKPLKIDDYQWSEDGRYVLVFTNTKKFRRYKSLGDYWLLNLEIGQLRQIAPDADPSTLMYAKFSPDSQYVAFVREHNIYLESVDGSASKQLTNDGSNLIVNGIGDWVNEEEFSLRDGFRWSPDSKRIAYWQFDTEGVGTFYMIKNTDDVYSKPLPLQYPKPGTTNSAVRVGTLDIETGSTIWVNLPDDPRQNYVPEMNWADSSEEVILQYMNRLQNTNRVVLADVSTGAINTVFTDTDEAWLDDNDNPKWLDGGNYFTWLSERDGWRHLYLISRDGSDIKLLTPGEFDITSVRNIDTEAGWVYYIASPDDNAARYLFRSPLTGAPTVERLTPNTSEGVHTYRIAPNSKWAFHTYSNFGTPPVTNLVALPAHETTRPVVDNADVATAVQALPRGDVDFFTVDIGSENLLDGWMMKPPSFDPSKKYPLLMYVYSEPAGQTVMNRWAGDRYLWHLMLSQQGFVVASVDSHGTPAPRGRAWRKSIYRQIGLLASEDQAKAVEALLQQHSYLDRDRVGVWGWSGGGSMTLNAMFRYPDLYHVGVSVAPVTNQRLYDTIYQERYMGLPDDNEEGYRLGSPITFADGLKGDLLLIHGTADDNVHYQSSEQLVDKLIELNKPFSFMMYPDRSHSINEKDGTKRHFYGEMTRFLHQNLK